jgi:hypothetical protein
MDDRGPPDRDARARRDARRRALQRFTVATSSQTNVARVLARLRRTGDSWRIVGVQILETTEQE